jgi:hypothetical protein
MSSINEIARDFETENREVELINPKGKPTGWFFVLRHESSEEVETFMAEYRSKLQDAALKRKTTAQKQLMRQHEDRLRLVQVAGWRWAEGEDAENGRPPFSRKELQIVFGQKGLGWHIRDFIDREVGSLEDFLAKSQES